LQLERVLTKLKFDESVSGYALITSDGHPFLSFSLPDEILPQIKGTLRIHGNDLKLVNIMTNNGIVILARVDPKWVLAVLFESDFQLGGALSRTKAVVDLLVQVDLPPPPATIGVEEEVAPLIEEEPIAERESHIPDEPQEFVAETTAPPEPTEPIPMEAITTEAPEEPEIEPVEVRHGCVVHRGEKYKDSVTLDSELNVSLKKAYANVGIDILLIIDEKMTVYKLAEHLARPVEKVIEIVEWCVSREVLWVECPEEQESAQKEIIELPLFEGKIDKAKKKHRPVLELCDGRRTLQEIATELGIPNFEALQCVVPYRGKTVRFIRTDKASRF
jgi:predicted regulator of Ras-like GTPase activity (Roadblock/LC7/MglB family)